MKNIILFIEFSHQLYIYSCASRNVNYRSTKLLWFSFITLLLLSNKSNHITKSFLCHRKKNYECLIVRHQKLKLKKREKEKLRKQNTF